MIDGDRLHTEITQIEGIPVVRVYGEIDLYTVPDLQRALNDVLELGTSAVIVDLNNISYIDSAGLSALIVAYKALSTRNGQLYVLAVPHHPGVYHVLEITRLDKVFCVRQTVEQVLADLGVPKVA